MSKKIRLLMGLLVSLSFLAACGSDSASNTDTDLSSFGSFIVNVVLNSDSNDSAYASVVTCQQVNPQGFNPTIARGVSEVEVELREQADSSPTTGTNSMAIHLDETGNGCAGHRVDLEGDALQMMNSNSELFVRVFHEAGIDYNFDGSDDATATDTAQSSVPIPVEASLSALTFKAQTGFGNCTSSSSCWVHFGDDTVEKLMQLETPDHLHQEYEYTLHHTWNCVGSSSWDRNAPISGHSDSGSQSWGVATGDYSYHMGNIYISDEYGTPMVTTNAYSPAGTCSVGVSSSLDWYEHLDPSTWF